MPFSIRPYRRFSMQCAVTCKSGAHHNSHTQGVILNSVMRCFRIRTLMVVALPAFVLSSGCGILPTGQYPTTDGFHHSLPPTNTRIVIWGNSPIVTGTATTWLQKRGLRVVERAKLLQLFEEQRIRLTHTADDEGPILRVGKLLGAGMVVFTDASVTSGVVSNYSVNADGGGGGSVTVNSASVSIRGVDVETSEVVWNGTARYPQPSGGSPEDGLAKLTCQALATAWGFRPSGEQAISSQSMCDAEKPITLTTPE
jgi:hypothetical protein